MLSINNFSTNNTFLLQITKTQFTMPTLPPYFNGKLSGVLTLSVLDIIWYKSCTKSTYVQFEWTGSQEKHKLL